MNTSKLLVLYVIAGLVFCSGLYLHISKPSAKAEIAKWTMVLDKTTHKGEPLYNDHVWVISPAGEWLIVPDAYKERLKMTKNGETFTLPESVSVWDRVIRKPSKEDCAKLRMGLLVSKTNSIDPDIKSVMIPGYFYSK